MTVASKADESGRGPEQAWLRFPCFPPLYFLLAGILPPAVVAFEFCDKTSGFLLFAGLVSAGLTIFPRIYWKWIVASACGVTLTLVHDRAPWRTYPDLLLRDEAYAEIRGIVVDNRILHEDVLADWAAPKYVELYLFALRLNKHNAWQSCSGKIYLKNTGYALIYGSAIEARGKFVLPFTNEIPGAFNYRNYLKIKGIRHLYEAFEITTLPISPTAWRRFAGHLIQCRERILLRLTSHIRGEENQKILSAMTLGFRPRFDRGDRETFIRSGAIHILAISGLHIGILYTILMMFLNVAGIPFSVRYFLAPVMLLMYVLAAGAAPSAVRAWLMITVWSVGRGLRLPVVAVNSIFLAAAILLLFNPFYIFHSGFQFSFLVVICLVEGWRHGRVLLAYLNEKRLWIPGAIRHSRMIDPYQIKSVLFKSGFSMTAAWFGSFGLTAFYNHLVLPLSIFTNIVICLLAWVIIFLSVVKLMVSFLPVVWPVILAADLLSWSLSGLTKIIRFAADYGCPANVPQPSLAGVAAYYIVLLMGLVFASAKYRLKLLGLTVAIVFVIIVGGTDLQAIQPRISILIPSGSVVPVILFRGSPPSGETILLNFGSYKAGYSLADWLHAKGIDVIDHVIVLDNRSVYYSGGYHLTDTIRSRTFSVLAQDRRNLDSLKRIQWRFEGRLRFTGNDLTTSTVKIRKERTDTAVSYGIRVKLDETYTVTIAMSVDNLEGSHMKLDGLRHDGTIIWQHDFDILYGNRTIIREYAVGRWNGGQINGL